MVWDCKYHIVLVPEYRYKIFDRELKLAVRDEIKKLCIWMRVGLIEGHVCDDHIHICLAIPPKISISDVIGTIEALLGSFYHPKRLFLIIFP